MYFIAVLSGDENMIKAFEAPAKLPLTDQEGNQVYDEKGNPKYFKNPNADLHTITTKTCCFPEVFEGKPFSEWSAIARNPEVIQLLGDPRLYGKKTNFGIVYLQTPKTMAEQNYLPVEICEKWRNNHEQQFFEAHRWIAEQEDWANVRGWARNSLGRQRWTREDNAKKQGASPGRSGVNHLVQSLGAELAKMSIIRIEKLFRGTPAKLIGLIHDEVLLEVPGSCSLSLKETKEGSSIYDPCYIPDKEAKSWAEYARLELENTQTELFDMVVQDINVGRFKGKAEADISVFWSH